MFRSGSTEYTAADFEEQVIAKVLVVKLPSLGSISPEGCNTLRHDLVIYAPNDEWKVVVEPTIHCLGSQCKNEDGQVDLYQEPSMLIGAKFNVTSGKPFSGSASFQVTIASGEVLRHESVILLETESFSVELPVTSHRARTSSLNVMVRMATSLGPAKAHLFNPLPIGDLVDRMLSGKMVQNVKYVLYNKIPTGKATRTDLGFVFADHNFLASRCEYFQSALHFGTGVDATKTHAVMPGSEENELTGMPDFAETNDYSSDSDFESDEGDNSDEEDDEEDDDSAAGAHENALVPCSAEVVHIPDTAYKTWKAMVYYLYSGNVSFAPLKSTQRTLEPPRWSVPVTLKSDIPEVSSKSMYRLADKLGIPELEGLALQHIESQLQAGSVCDELFSVYTSRYEKVKRVQMRYLLRNWDGVLASSRLDLHLQQLSEMKAPHTLTIFKELFLSLRVDRFFKA